MEYMERTLPFCLLLICVESVKTSKGGEEKAQIAREFSSSLQPYNSLRTNSFFLIALQKELQLYPLSGAAACVVNPRPVDANDSDLSSGVEVGG